MLRISCPNGHRLSAAAEHAGKKVKCPKCGVVVRLPQPEIETFPEEEWDLSGAEATDNGSSSDEGYGSWRDSNEEAPALPPRSKSVNRPARKETVAPAPTAELPTGHRRKYLIPAACGAGLLAVVLMVWFFIFSGGEENSSDQPTLASSTPVVKPQVPAASGSNTAAPPGPLLKPTLPEPGSVAAAENTAPMLKAAEPVPDRELSKSNVPATDTPAIDDSANTGSTASDASASIPWNIRPPETHNLAFDERFILHFKRAPGKLQFAYAKEGQPAPTSKSDWTKVSDQLTASDDVESTLPLQASMMKNQNVVILASEKFAALNGKTVPFPIRIGSEVMQVVSVDDFKGVIEVKRTSPVAHSVSEPVEVLKAGATSVATNQGRPFLQNEVEMHWFPPKDLAGGGTIFVRYVDPREKKQVGFGWRVLIADGDTIARLNREQRGPEDDGLKPLTAPIWKYTGSPIPPLPPSEKAAIKNANADIAVVIAKLRRSKKFFGIRFEQDSADKRRILIRSSDSASPVNEELVIPPGAGVELTELDIKKAKVEIVPVKTESVSLDGEPLVSNDEQGRLRTQIITGIIDHADLENESEAPAYSHGRSRRPEILPAENGRIVFTVGFDDKLTRTNLETLKQESRVQLPSTCEAICLCSEGLVVLCRVPDSPNEFVLNDANWKMVDFGAGKAQRSSSSYLYLLDPESLKVKKSYLFRGHCVAGNADAPTIYVGDATQISAINMESATLTEAISVWPRTPPFATPPATEENSREIRLLGDYQLCCDVDGATLLAIGTSPGSADPHAAGMYRFRIGNGTAEFQESLKGVALQDSPWCVSRDGNLLSFRVTATGASFITSTDSLSQMMPNVVATMPLGIVSAMDPDSRAYLSAFKRSDLLTGYRLWLSQGRKSFEVDIGEAMPTELRSLGQGRFLLTTDSNAHLVHVNAKAEYWPFEADLAFETPELSIEGTVVVPEAPLKPSDKLPKGRIEFDPPGLEFLTWSPSGDAYFLNYRKATDDPRVFLSIIHRMDAATNIETHRWTLPGGAVFNTYQVSASGLLVSEHGTNDFLLLSFNDLSLLWRINCDRLGYLSASPQHSIVVGSKDGFGIMVCDVGAQTVVARDGLLNHRIPELPWKQFSVRASNDPDVIFLASREEYRELRVNNGLLELASETVIPKADVERITRRGFRPDGYSFELDSSSIVMISPEGTRKRLNILDDATRIWPHPISRNRIALESQRKVIIVEFQP